MQRLFLQTCNKLNVALPPRVLFLIKSHVWRLFATKRQRRQTRPANIAVSRRRSLRCGWSTARHLSAACRLLLRGGNKNKARRRENKGSSQLTPEMCSLWRRFSHASFKWSRFYRELRFLDLFLKGPVWKCHVNTELHPELVYCANFNYSRKSRYAWRIVVL